MIVYTTTALLLLFNKITTPIKAIKFTRPLILILITILIGLRHEIGVDWNAYLEIYNTSSESSWYYFFTDPIYQILNKTSSAFGLGIYGVNFSCALIGCIPTYILLRKNKNFNISFFICFTYFFLVVGMGYTRQFAATGFFVLAAMNYQEGKIKTSILNTILAIGLHSTAAFLVPIIFWNGKLNKKTIIITITITTMMAISFKGKIETFIQMYLVDGEISSAGALYRTLLHTIAAFILIFTKKRINYYPQNLFKAYFFVSILSTILILIKPDATFIDRILVYFLPFQAIAMANFSNMTFLKSKWSRLLSKLIITSIFVFMLFFWMLYSNYKDYWIPYKSILFI